jgi:hypothetical protein
MEDTKLNIAKRETENSSSPSLWRRKGRYGSGTFPCNNGTDRLWCLPTESGLLYETQPA